MKRAYLEKEIERRKLTLTEISKAVGVSRQMITFLISGKNDPSWNLAKKLANYFEIPAEILFEVKNDNLNITSEKKLYDVDEFCSEVLNNKISRSTVYAKIKTGEIKAIKIGRKPLIPAWFVEELLTSHDI